LVHSEGPGDLRRQRIVEIAVDFDQVFQPAGLAVEGCLFQCHQAGDRLAGFSNDYLLALGDLFHETGKVGFRGVDVDDFHD